MPKFKEWFNKKTNFNWLYASTFREDKHYGYSGCKEDNGYEPKHSGWEANSDKMQKITLKEWDKWFNK